MYLCECDENKPPHLLNYTIFDCLGMLKLIKVVDNFDAEYQYITNEKTVFTFKTNLNAPTYRLINIDFSNYAQV